MPIWNNIDGDCISFPDHCFLIFPINLFDRIQNPITLFEEGLQLLKLHDMRVHFDSKRISEYTQSDSRASH